jgi:hypothetical protein
MRISTLNSDSFRRTRGKFLPCKIIHHDTDFRRGYFIPNPQRRACKTNCCLILFPLALCSVIGGLQIAINHASSQGGGGGGGATPAIRLDCSCSNVSVDENALGGIQCPDECPLPRAPKWPPVVKTPSPEYRAVQDGLFPFADLPDASCRAEGSCPATFLVTSDNHSFVGSKFFFSVQLSTPVQPHGLHSAVQC